MKQIANGVYPVMITPFTAEGQIDFEAVDRLVEFYIENGCSGIFAVCQSSEMFYLSEDERVALARRVVEDVHGRISVVASGHISVNIEDQIRELRRISETGVDATVMISCRLAAEDEDDEVLIQNMNTILEAIPNVTFGMYECPYPYKRLLSEKVLEAMASSQRFAFIKDTCCDAALIAHRLEILQGRIQLFNANSATMLETLRSGAAGFSGVMANLHPDLIVWLYDHYQDQPEKAEKLAACLSLLSGIERGYYPVSAKYHADRIGIKMTTESRTKDPAGLNYLYKHEMDDLIAVEELLRDYLKSDRS